MSTASFAQQEPNQKGMEESSRAMAAAEEEKKAEKPKSKARLIVRLAGILVAHSALVSVICCIAGFVALLLLPVLAKNTYISENALMPGSANAMFSNEDVLEADRFVKDILDRKDEITGREIPRLIRKHMADVSTEVYHHKFLTNVNHFHPLGFFSSNPNKRMRHNNSSCTSYGVNSVGIVRAPRGDGKEAIVLVTPYNSENIQVGEALSLGLAFSVFSLLSRAVWLAKDIVWLAADSRYGEYTSVAAWLNDYNNPVFRSNPGEMNAGICYDNSIFHDWDGDLVTGKSPNNFKRAGTVAAALVFKITEKNERAERDSLTIYAEASNGQMPNLDLINIVHYLAVYRQGLHVKVGTISSLLKSRWVNLIGEILQRLDKLIANINPKWKFDIASSDYTEGAATLASSMYYQALGVPTGSHGAFRDYQVDAITLELSPGTSLRYLNSQSRFLLRNGRLIEGVLRSVNNLLEKFHQSFFLYFLTAPHKFVSVGVYMIAFALLVAPLPIVAAALFSGKNNPSGSTKTSEPSSTSTEEAATRSWKWLHSAKVVLMVHLWAVAISLLPSLISYCPHVTSGASMLAWAGLSIFILLVLHVILGSPYLSDEWKILKAVMIAAVSIGLGLMSIINFSTAQIGAMLVVPMCLMVQPFKYNQSALGLRAALLACNLALVVVAFPPVALMILKGMFEGFGTMGIGDFWEWAESLWVWNSATYLYLLLIHLPCWVLCIHILLHP